MSIMNNGNVGIGTTNPDSKLRIQGNHSLARFKTLFPSQFFSHFFHSFLESLSLTKHFLFVTVSLYIYHPFTSPSRALTHNSLYSSSHSHHPSQRHILGIIFTTVSFLTLTAAPMPLTLTFVFFTSHFRLFSWSHTSHSHILIVLPLISSHSSLSHTHISHSLSCLTAVFLACRHKHLFLPVTHTSSASCFTHTWDGQHDPSLAL